MTTRCGATSGVAEHWRWQGISREFARFFIATVEEPIAPQGHNVFMAGGSPRSGSGTLASIRGTYCRFAQFVDAPMRLMELSVWPNTFGGGF